MTLATDQPDSADESLRATYSGAKRKIAALEQQLEDLRNAGSKHKSYVPFIIARWSYQLVSVCYSNTVSNITQGRIIPRLVSTFQPIDELVDENDRRHALEIDGGSDLVEYTIEYVLHGICTLLQT
jgi:hypothetical protein